MRLRTGGNKVQVLEADVGTLVCCARTLAKESLTAYQDIDIAVRGEGEQTLARLVETLKRKRPLSIAEEISFRHGGEVTNTSDRSLLRTYLIRGQKTDFVIEERSDYVSRPIVAQNSVEND